MWPPRLLPIIDHVLWSRVSQRTGTRRNPDDFETTFQPINWVLESIDRCYLICYNCHSSSSECREEEWLSIDSQSRVLPRSRRRKSQLFVLLRESLKIILFPGGTGCVSAECKQTDRQEERVQSTRSSYLPGQEDKEEEAIDELGFWGRALRPPTWNLELTQIRGASGLLPMKKKTQSASISCTRNR